MNADKERHFLVQKAGPCAKKLWMKEVDLNAVWMECREFLKRTSPSSREYRLNLDGPWEREKL